MATRTHRLPAAHCAARLAVSLAILFGTAANASAAWSTLIDNGRPTNRVDIVFVGDGYTQADLNAGIYANHIQNYVDYMFGAPAYLADPFPRYAKFFNVHQIDIVSAQSGADRPSQGIYRDTALGAAYDSHGIDRLLTINEATANAYVYTNLFGSGIWPDIRLATVNDTTYGGSGGSWAVYAGGNSYARDIALHELSHAFSKTIDEYTTSSSAYVGGEPSAANATTNPSGAKWSEWLGFNDPRADYLRVDVFEGAAGYASGIYRPTLDSKMRTLDRPFNAIVREQTIFDIYAQVDPLDSWLDNQTMVHGSELWVETVDPSVIHVDWYVNNELIAENHGEVLDLNDFNLGSGTYTIRAHAYDEVIRHAGDGSLLDLVRSNFSALEQNVSWSVNFSATAPQPGDFNLDGAVDIADYQLWRRDFGSTTALDADGNGDGRIDAADFTVWRNHLGSGAAGLVGGEVPEPSTTWWVAFIAAVWMLRSRRGASIGAGCCV